MENAGGIDIVLVVTAVLGVLHNAVPTPVLQHTSALTGQMYFDEIMQTYNVHRFHEVARMDRATFLKFQLFLSETGGLLNSLYICNDQKLMILIQVFRGYTVRQIR